MRLLIRWLILRWDLWQLCRKGYLVKKKGGYEVTAWAEASKVWGQW